MNKMVKMSVSAALAAALAASSSAMPSKGDFAKAQPLVNELMAPLVNGFKAKTKTAMEVAASAEAYSREAETEAAKFLLLKGAITYYSRAGEYDKAANAVDMLSASVKNVPADVMLDIISRATSKISKENAPRLYAKYREVSASVRAEKELGKLKDKLARNPKDMTVRRRYAELLAVSGAWEKALGEFSALKDKSAEIASAEKAGNGQAVEWADYWWNYDPEEAMAVDAFKAHAAVLYRKAMAAGGIPSLKKTIIERRIASIAGSAALAQAASAGRGPAAPVAKLSAQGKGGKWDIPPGFTVPLVRSLDLGGETMDFAACPGGEVSFTSHKANITRPFWISCTVVSPKQFAAFPTFKKALQLGNMTPGKFDKFKEQFKDDPTAMTLHFLAVENVLHGLNAKYGGLLPDGYVFRLPTEAEIFHAYYAGVAGSDLTVFMNSARETHARLLELGWVKSVEESGRAFAYEVLRDAGYGALRIIELLDANAWGVRPTGAGDGILTLDSIDLPGGGDRNIQVGSEAHALKLFKYADVEVDPLRFGASRVLMSCYGAIGYNSSRLLGWTGMPGFFHIAIGPDLVKEKKAAAAKK